MKIRIGSRGSALALTQTNSVARALNDLGHDTEVITVQTAGDRDRDRRFAEIGAPGVFVREIEAALLDGKVDLAVHSYKDLPSQNPEGLVVAAIPERLDPADCLIARPDGQTEPWIRAAETGTLAEETEIDLPLEEGAVVGTASERRSALLRSLRPDVRLEPIRGNVPTRIAKLVDGSYDAIVLAAAGLKRLERRQDAPDLGLDDLVVVRLDPAVFVPAPAQGALALQCREGDRVVDAVAPLHDDDIAGPVRAERQLLKLVDGGCNLPFGAWCRWLDGSNLELVSVIEAGGRLVRESGSGRHPGELAEHVWERLSGKLGRALTDETAVEAQS